MKILLAVDGSEFSQAATQALVSQMRREGAEVPVLRVVEPPHFLPRRKWLRDMRPIRTEL